MAAVQGWRWNALPDGEFCGDRLPEEWRGL
jgi:hypothetical protein